MLDSIAELRTPTLFYLLILIPLVVVVAYQLIAPRFFVPHSIIAFLLGSLFGGYFLHTRLHYPVTDYLAAQFSLVFPVTMAVSWLVSKLPVRSGKMDDPLKQILEEALRDKAK